MLHAFRVEARDPEWSGWAEGALHAALEAGMPEGTSIVSLQCTASLCRMEADFDDALAQGEGLQLIGNVVPWPSDGYFEAVGGDALRMAFYISREGRALPLPGG